MTHLCTLCTDWRDNHAIPLQAKQVFLSHAGAMFRLLLSNRVFPIGIEMKDPHDLASCLLKSPPQHVTSHRVPQVKFCLALAFPPLLRHKSRKVPE